MTIDVFSLMAEEHTIPHHHSIEYYAIGDVHGCMDEYNSLCNLIAKDAMLRGKHFRIIQLGDMIDRGPHFVKLVLNDRARYRLMGNHEWNFILEHYGYKACRSKPRQVNHDKLQEESLEVQESVLNVLKDRRFYYILRADYGNFVFTHAPVKGVDVGKSVKEIMFDTNGNDMCMGSKLLDMERFLEREESVTFIFGHQSWNYTDIKDQVEAQKNSSSRVFNLDSGCVYGKELVALRLSDLGILRVQSNVCVD